MLYPCPREGGAHSDPYENKATEGLLPLLSAPFGHERSKNPASEEAGPVDPAGSVAVAAGPDQREAVVALTLHQRGVDRGGEARIVELDREIFAIGFPCGLLPGGAEFGVMWCTT